VLVNGSYKKILDGLVEEKLSEIAVTRFPVKDDMAGGCIDVAH
jgi:hypothetical protein